MAESLRNLLDAVLAGVIAVELLKMSEAFSEWLVKKNATRAPRFLQPRLEMELLHGLHSIPAPISKLMYSFDTYRLVASLTRKQFLKFEKIWEECADLGWCDSLGGVEFRRVKSEWVSEEELFDVAGYIHQRANI